jgi:hypothetical protein
MTRAEPAGTEPRTAKAAAMAFLRAALAGQVVPAAELSRRAHAHGLTPKAIRSAREALDVKIARNGFGPGGQWLWSLPAKAGTGARIDAQPIPSEEGRPKTEDRYEVTDAVCDYCGERDGTVYLVPNPFAGGRSEPLHEACAGHWFEWLGKRGGQRGGHGQA